MNAKKNNQNESKLVINPNIVEDLENQRYAEAEGIIQALRYFPGSSREELWQLEPSCEDCFNRIMVWLEAEGVIYQEGEFYYLADED